MKDRIVSWCKDTCMISNRKNLEFNKFTMVEFSCGDYILPAATRTPHALFGVSNLWINKNIQYVSVDIDNKKYIMTNECVEKLLHQDFSIGDINEIDINDIPNEADVPITNKKIPIINADFVIPSLGSGIVVSVPAHSIFDYVAWKDAGMNGAPGFITSIPGFGNAPARELYEKFLNSDNDDINSVSQELYSIEFEKGVLNKECMQFAGMKVTNAMGIIHDYLIENGCAKTLYEINMGHEIKCKCGSEIIPHFISKKIKINKNIRCQV